MEEEAQAVLWSRQPYFGTHLCRFEGAASSRKVAMDYSLCFRATSTISCMEKTWGVDTNNL